MELQSLLQANPNGTLQSREHKKIVPIIIYVTLESLELALLIVVVS